MNSTCQNGTPYARAGITELTSGKVNIEISALLKDTLLLIKKMAEGYG